MQWCFLRETYAAVERKREISHVHKRNSLPHVGERIEAKKERGERERENFFMFTRKFSLECTRREMRHVERDKERMPQRHKRRAGREREMEIGSVMARKKGTHRERR